MKRQIFAFVKKKEQDKFRKILNCIQQANDVQISEIVQAVIRRYKIVFPDWEICFLSLHKDPSKRREEVEALIRFLRTHDQ